MGRKMKIDIVRTRPFADQKMGTSGLRKKTKVLLDNPNYLENFLQALFDTADVKGKKWVVGGDGRFLNKEALQVILKMAVANGAKEIWVGKNGLFSTPAVSVVIRKYHLDGGIILSASHNPAGTEGDFGIKFNMSNGGPASEQLTQRIFEKTQIITEYKMAQMEPVDLSKECELTFGKTKIRIIDSIKDYIEKMETIFDFNAIRKMLKKGFRMYYDAFNAVTGPYAHVLFEDVLGAPKGTVANGVPLEDFGGIHPEPNQVYAVDLQKVMNSKNAPDFGAASDGDGDRYMIMGKSFFVYPADSLAILTLNAHLIKGYKGKVVGVARSMPTAGAVDLVAKKMGIPTFETPTGWKFFGSLLDAGKVTFCGEESFGSSSFHIREKDGLWGVLFWLNILAVTGKTVKEIVEDFWKEFGRFYTERFDFFIPEKETADNVLKELKANAKNLKGKVFNGLKIKQVKEFNYTDPVTGDKSMHQGIIVQFDNHSRIVYRLSGTGTVGATMRVYLEKFEPDAKKQNEPVFEYMKDIASAVFEIAQLPLLIGKTKPDFAA